MARHALVDLLDALTNGGIELGERKELTFTELCDDPSLRDLYSYLNLGFVFRLIRTCRDNCGVIMLSHLPIRAIDVRLVKAGLGDARFQIITDDHRAHTTKVAEGACRSEERRVGKECR